MKHIRMKIENLNWVFKENMFLFRGREGRREGGFRFVWCFLDERGFEREGKGGGVESAIWKDCLKKWEWK